MRAYRNFTAVVCVMLRRISNAFLAVAVVCVADDVLGLGLVLELLLMVMWKFD